MTVEGEYIFVRQVCQGSIFLAEEIGWVEVWDRRELDNEIIKEGIGRRWVQMGVHEGLICYRKEFTGFCSCAEIFSANDTDSCMVLERSLCTGLDGLKGVNCVGNR